MCHRSDDHDVGSNDVESTILIVTPTRPQRRVATLRPRPGRGGPTAGQDLSKSAAQASLAAARPTQALSVCFALGGQPFSTCS